MISSNLTPFVRTVRLCSLALLLGALGACGGSETVETPAADADRGKAMRAHMQAHFDSFLALPPDVVEALERGELTQAEVDARAANGEFEKFFQFRTPADLPADLEWQDGQDLPDLGSPEAKKGGTLYGAIAD